LRDDQAGDDGAENLMRSARVGRTAFALFATLALHVLGVAWWFKRDTLVRVADEPRSAVMVWLQVPLRPILPLPKPEPANRAPAAAPLRRPPEAIRQAIAPTAVVPDRREAANLPSAQDIVERARRDIGKIDRDLRGRAPIVPLEKPDSAQARFERGMAAAFIDRSLTMTMDRYTSPDGVVITRITQGGGTACYMSGTVNFVPGVLKNSERPNSVNCPPASAGWTRY
jgi:hypothetical protein